MHNAVPGDLSREPSPQAVSFPALERRQFLRLMAASLALSGAGACSRPPKETVVPYVRAPELGSSGEPVFYATAAAPCGVPIGMLVRCNGGRPTKIEGNPLHPGSLGATDAFTQACVLDLWDPDRSQALRTRGEAGTWTDFSAQLRRRLDEPGRAGGEGVRILTGAVHSPTLAGQISALLSGRPHARWHWYEPLHRDEVLRGSQLVYGRPLVPRHRLDKARTIITLDCDFLGAPGVRSARDFAQGRRSAKLGEARPRLIAVESLSTLTGAMADERLALAPALIEALARELARGLGLAVAASPLASKLPSGVVDAMTASLRASGPASLVLVGDSQPAAVHALAHAIHEELGAPGTTVDLEEPGFSPGIPCAESMTALVRDMRAGAVDTLIVLGGNPVYDAPADLAFAAALERVAFSSHLSLYENETSLRCLWHVPQAHFLEHWSDVGTQDGTCAIQQPLIAPLYGGRSAHQMMALLAGDPDAQDHTTVRSHWMAARPGPGFESFWRESLRRGIIEAAPAPQAKAMRIRAGMLRELAPAAASVEDALLFVPDATVYDGRFANNAWLQELPKPLSKLTWDNAALLGPEMARRLEVEDGDEIEVLVAGVAVTAPVLVVPGQAAGCIGLPLGYGRTRAGRVGNGAGFDAYRLRRSDAMWTAQGFQVRRTGGHRELSLTQHHFQMEDRSPVRTVELEELRRNAQARPAGAGPSRAPTLYEPRAGDGYAWAMNIDLDACTGCSACTIACQAENNIPVVGRREVRRGREMHWIRVDRYTEGPPENPRTSFQPVPCMQCEHAPCEAVCPVEATVHDSEGLNLQVYNRCIGTRFCSNNCPYKVRRFNFLQYTDERTESLKGQRNPDVTVRMRGVMEKCTYCLQRITAARIESERLGRRIGDGDVVTACEAACPTSAIVFGDLNDPGSRVGAARASPRHYVLLEALNTRPRTTYLARIAPRPTGATAASGAGGST